MGKKTLFKSTNPLAERHGLRREFGRKVNPAKQREIRGSWGGGRGDMEVQSGEGECGVQWRSEGVLFFIHISVPIPF